ncbi:MAG: UDP-N-acetylmuramoyl-L-alanyl-D-glutamate--2,6-diaminopimelate ligase [Oscillospiraceae bacterium]|nr:UDP-N-acetylmuramoyl-L-alanyl-D-glutamate--2,6-diaminopimelate ligase [Oscillospiraceae bacterium]
MKLVELLAGAEISGHSAGLDLDAEARGVSYDSRTCKRGDIFVAIRGMESDGHDHVTQALERGAVCAVTDRALPDGAPYICVANTRAALAVISANFFGNPAKKLRMIAVTGTNGKTTVTSLIKGIIERATGEKSGLIGTVRNMIGDEELRSDLTTPESYELHGLLAKMAEHGCRYAVMEVSSHALELDRVYGMEFEVGVFTNLTPDHLDFHGTMEKYGEAKLRLFKQCRAGALNLDDAFSREIMRSSGLGKDSLRTFSAMSVEADLVAKRIRLFPDSTEFCALTIGTLQTVRIGIPGMFSVHNALAAISAAMLLGIDIQAAAAALGECPGIMGRAEVVPTGRDYTVIIDYAHTPDALEKIITAMRQSARGRVVTLFGCGGDRDRAKRPLMGGIATRLSDFTVITTDNPRTEEPRAIIDDILAGVDADSSRRAVIEDRREAIKWALASLRPGDVLILAGKGHETYQVIGKEKTHLDEREVVAEALAAAAC